MTPDCIMIQNNAGQIAVRIYNENTYDLITYYICTLEPRDETSMIFSSRAQHDTK